ncbi:MAG: biotin/lipoyl-binding protein, partial [Clostridia bacterium]|nr:biotin/lipoyl-binding protein [Clostridia bacterium]
MAELEKEFKEEPVFSEDAAESEAPTFSEGEGEESGGEESFVDPKRKKRKKKLIIFGIIGGVIFALILFNIIGGIIRAQQAKKDMYKDVAVERHTITKSITGSSNIEPNDSYNVMTMKSGDITADYFKEGDTVKKGDKLYQFDDEDARGSLKSAQNAVTKAEQGYVDAVKQKAQTVSNNDISSKNSQNAINKALNGLNDAQKSYNDQYIKSDISGQVTNLSVKQGDWISNGTNIATVYSDTYMKIRVPFNDY